MTCGEARELFSALVDEALTPDERVALDRHLAGCAECRAELSRFGNVVSLVRAVEPERAPVGFVDRVLARADSTPWYRRLARVLIFPLPVKLPLGAAAMVLVGVLVSLLYRQSPELQQAARHDPLPAPPAAVEGPAVSQAPAPAPPAREAPAVGKATAPPGSVQTPATPSPQEGAAPRQDALQSRRSAPEPAAPMKDNREAGGRAEPAPEREATAGIAADKKEAGAPDLDGRLTVGDLTGAESELGSLIARSGGRQTSRRPIQDGLEVEVEIPRARADEFTRELARIGRWQAARTAESAADPLRVRIQLVR
ncbi:MAG TPA: zf-HC2 domain-containing protein [Methylomirabilota bacterium]|nr:zf-HC2 domain-containing protein [Methylomirabilota bacterium]